MVDSLLGSGHSQSSKSRMFDEAHTCTQGCGVYDRRVAKFNAGSPMQTRRTLSGGRSCWRERKSCCHLCLRNDCHPCPQNARGENCPLTKTSQRFLAAQQRLLKDYKDFSKVSPMFFRRVVWLDGSMQPSSSAAGTVALRFRKAMRSGE